jgi:hypothetical protein
MKITQMKPTKKYQKKKRGRRRKGGKERKIYADTSGSRL